MVTALMLTCVWAAAAALPVPGYYTAECVEAARAKVKRGGWAAQRLRRLAAAAKRWLALPDEQLWLMIPGQNVPRCVDVTMERDSRGRYVRHGCLVCGDKIFKFGNYPYRVDIFGHPWQVQCPSCGTWFPFNDFGAYWRSGLDERGLFDPKRADRSLLFNRDHPAPGDPKRGWGVDDGFGFVDSQGRRYKWIAYYTWRLWRALVNAAQTLAEAYVLSGDVRYARKAIIILDRIADVYPEMDWAPYAKMGWFHSDGGSGMGKIEGRIWECGVVTKLARAYDMVKPALGDEQVVRFLAGQARKYKVPLPKDSAEAIARNIEGRLLACAAEAIMRGQIRGNEGMHQLAMAWVAVAYNRQPQTGKWLDWLFRPDGGRLTEVVMHRMDRDGFGAEGAPSYSMIWPTKLAQVAELLAGYGQGRHDIYRRWPRLINGQIAGLRAWVLGLGAPSIGDCGACGAFARVGPDAASLARAFAACGDRRLAAAAWARAGGRVDCIREPLFAADWERIRAEIEKAGREGLDGQLFSGPDHLRGYGLASLEVGSGKSGTAAWLFYGQNYGHGHRDRLNFGIVAFGVELAPDLGYPEYATRWPKRMQWTGTTISHNTVVVDGLPQRRDRIGRAVLFKVVGARHRPVLEVVEVSSPEVYQRVEEYQRTLALVPVGGGAGYVVDVFRVRGGREHIYSFHGPPGEQRVESLKLVAQEGGTYAGPDVPFGPGVHGKAGEGFSWLYGVRRQENPPERWSIVFECMGGYRAAKGDERLSMFFCTELSDVALAWGEPPQNKPGNPRRLPYVLARRRGDEGLESTFVAVYDPWRQGDGRHVTEVERLEVKGGEAARAVALRVRLADGREDWIGLCAEPSAQCAAGPLRWRGRVAFVRVEDGQPAAAALVEGTILRFGRLRISLARAAAEGRVVKFDKDTRGNAYLWVDAPLLPADSFVGEEIYVAGRQDANPAYEIWGIARQGRIWRVDCGPVDFVHGLRDVHDYEAGFVYAIEAGQAVRVPCHAAVELRNGRYVLVDVAGQAKLRAQ